jgi:hypothetical protein
MSENRHRHFGAAVECRAADGAHRVIEVRGVGGIEFLQCSDRRAREMSSTEPVRFGTPCMTPFLFRYAAAA